MHTFFISYLLVGATHTYLFTYLPTYLCACVARYFFFLLYKCMFTNFFYGGGPYKRKKKKL